MATQAKKAVCIIGAGPAGLTAAKTLIHDHPKGTFHVTVFEKSDRIGGLWPLAKEDEGMVNPDMPTNQSRHTVSFSDLAWPATAPLFPKAWQVGQYLQRYIDTYPGYEIKLGSRVVKTEILNEKWRVHVQDSKGTAEPEISEYDQVIVSSGFFSTPKIPQVLDGFAAPVIHSSKFRNPNILTASDGRGSADRGKNIVVVGGQMSGVDVAASVALQLSSDANAPGNSDKKDHDKLTITHVIQRPFWIMPLFFPTNPQIQNSPEEKKFNSSPNFLPLDLVFYNLENRPPGPITNTSGVISPEAAAFFHNLMNGLLGTDQSDLPTPELAISNEVRSEVPFLGISDTYTEFVRSGNIKVIKGKVTGHLNDGSNTIKVENGGEEQEIKDVAAVIFATGFEAAPTVDFLPNDILQDLQFDATGDEFPLELNVHSVISRKFPSLGFVGFYRSPYWGVIEMQARYLGKLWSGDEGAANVLAEDTTMDAMLRIRGDPRLSQFPMGDYVYLMESFRELLGIKRQEPNGDATSRTGVVFGPRYTFADKSETERDEIALALKLFHEEFENSKQGKYLARAVFRAMQGTWKLDREIKSFIDSYPSGKLDGTAQFLPRHPTAEGFDAEYLYLERGDFTSSAGHKFTAKRSYVYRYAAAADKLTVWFTKDDHLTVDYFFHEIKFEREPGPLGWRARSNHLCVEDMYDVEYDFAFKGVHLETWSPKYTVKGPNKDYTIQSHFSRSAGSFAS